jgi:hypothetical protein
MDKRNCERLLIPKAKNICLISGQKNFRLDGINFAAREFNSRLRRLLRRCRFRQLPTVFAKATSKSTFYKNMNEPIAADNNRMKRRRETMTDGRRLIYYTFGEKSQALDTPEKSEKSVSGVSPKQEMTEER